MLSMEMKRTKNFTKSINDEEVRENNLWLWGFVFKVFR